MKLEYLLNDMESIQKSLYLKFGCEGLQNLAYLSKNKVVYKELCK